MIKYFLIILILVPSFLFAKVEKPTLMLQLIGKNIKVSEDVKLVIRMGVEEVLTEKGYMLVSESNQKMALKEMSKQTKSDCLDDTCLVDTGGMLAAKGIFIVEIVKLGKEFAFKVKNIDIETAAVLKTKSMIYKGKLNNAEKLLSFSKELTNKIFKKQNSLGFKTKENDACNKDTPNICFELANKYKDGNGVPASIYKANNFYEKSCDYKNSDACLALGESYYEANGFKKNIKKALELYNKSCNLNNANACSKLGNTYYDGDINFPKSIVRANRYYAKACKLNASEACFYLAESYYKGNGLSKDQIKAFDFFQKSCNLNKKYCSSLETVVKEINKKKFISEVCKGKTFQKCYKIAKSYQLGKTVKKDLEVTNKLYLKLCDMRFGKACKSLGDNYKDGFGYPKNLRKALSLYIKSCKVEDKFGCANVAEIYLKDKFLKKGKREVYFYYKKACTLGFEDDICDFFKN